MRPFAQPKIPVGLLHDMSEIKASGEHTRGNGGQWKPGAKAETKFKGVVLPLDNEDLQHAPTGTSTVNTKKVYTNGYALRVGGQFVDSFDNKTYTVTLELTHGPLHPMKRYLVERKGASNPK